MSLSEWVKEARKSAPSWGISLVVHLVLILLAGMVTWVVVRVATTDRPLMLLAPEAGAEAVADSPEGAGGGDARPSEVRPFATLRVTEIDGIIVSKAWCASF